MTETKTKTETDAGEAMLGRARAAGPVLAEHAAHADKERRLAPESTAVLRDSGVFAMGTPTRFGGPDLSAAEAVRVLVELGRACPSAAWLASVSAEIKSTVDPLIGSEAAAEVFADPGVRLCGSALPPGQSAEAPGGLRVSGRWSYVSGCEDADWAAMMILTPGGGFAFVLMPLPDVEIERTWDTAGLRGTGSHTLVARELLVPSARVVEIPARPDGLPDLNGGRPLAVPLQSVYLLASMVGAAQGAAEVVSGIMATRTMPLMAHDTLADSPSARDLFARAVHLRDTAERGLLSLAARIDEHWPGTDVPEREQFGMGLEMVTIVNQCRESVDMLLDLHGSSGLALASPLQRFWRDLHMGTRHMRFTPYWLVEEYGLRLAGHQPGASG